MKRRIFLIPDNDYEFCKQFGKGNATMGFRLLIDVIREHFKEANIPLTIPKTAVKTEIKEKKQSNKNEEPITRALEQKYKELFFKHYKTDAIIAVKHRAIFKRIIQSVGKDKSIELVELYFKSDNPFYEKECHPVWLMEKDINKIFANFSYSEDAVMERIFNYVEDRSKAGYGVKNAY